MAEFKKLYGDFFVSGYVLGADAGICLSSDVHDRSEKESLKITVTVKVLFVSASASHTEEHAKEESSASLSVCGYSTMQNVNESVATRSASLVEQGEVQEVAARYMAMVASLEDDARERLRKLALLKEGHRLPLSTGFDACRAGLVVQLLLSPFSRMEEYVRVSSRRGGK